MLPEDQQLPNKNFWLSIAWFFLVFNYCAYMWPLLFDHSLISEMEKESPDFLEFQRGYLVMLITMSLIALFFSITKVKFWRFVVIVIGVFGLYTTEVFSVFQVWFNGIDSFADLERRWAIFMNYPWALSSGFRNGIFTPLLYAAIIIMVIQNWRNQKPSERAI